MELSDIITFCTDNSTKVLGIVFIVSVIMFIANLVAFITRLFLYACVFMFIVVL